MLIAGFPNEMWMLQQSKEEIVAFFSKKQLSKSSDKTSSTTGSSAAMFLVVPRSRPPRASENSDQMILRFNLFRFVSGKKCSSICPEITTENSIQMVNALGISKYFSRSISLTVFCRKITRTIERIVGTLTSGEM